MSLHLCAHLQISILSAPASASSHIPPSLFSSIVCCFNSRIQAPCCRRVRFVVKMFAVCTPLSLDCMLPIRRVALTCGCLWIVAMRTLVCRAKDHWEGYKIFCYAYYSHSSVHESVFRNSKLGQLVWSRHSRPPPPSHHVLRNTCMQLLPLVEMYCRGESQEDCSNLRYLMARYDSEAELQTHELGRSLLSMIRDEDMGFKGLPRADPPGAPTDPFAGVRERLAAMDSVIRDLHPQVHIHTQFCLLNEPTRIGINWQNTECRVGQSRCPHSFPAHALVQVFVQNFACSTTLYSRVCFAHLSACLCTPHLWQTVAMA